MLLHTLQSGTSTISVNLEGGRITSLILDKIPILGEFLRIDGYCANSHVCIPNFDTEGMVTYGLPRHGPFRTTDWQLIEHTEDMIRIQSTIEESEKYPSTLIATQQFKITRKTLSHEIKVENMSNTPAPVDIAFHYYWHTHGGWDGIRLNEKDVSNLVRGDTYCTKDPHSTIVFPDKTTIRLTTSGCSYLQFWTGRIEKNGRTHYDNSYVCIEPFIGEGDYFARPEALLSPRNMRSATVMFSVV